LPGETDALPESTEPFPSQTEVLPGERDALAGQRDTPKLWRIEATEVQRLTRISTKKMMPMATITLPPNPRVQVVSETK